MPKIFLSYRRADSAETTTRLYDRLVYAFGRENVFKDVDSIQRGDDFPDVLREWVMNCDVFLAVIGQKWLTIQDETGRRRIDSEKDWVRREMQMALERDKGAVLIPTVVDGASLPNEHALPDALRQLAFRDAQTLRADHFHPDVTALITSIRRRFGLGDAVPTLDLHKVYRDLVEVMQANDWDAAREILSVIRAADNIPATFRLDGIEGSIYQHVTKERRIRDYETLAHNADLVEKGLLAPQEMTAGLDAFIQMYGSLLPKDDWARVLRFLPVENTPVSSQRTVSSKTKDQKPSIVLVDDAQRTAIEELEKSRQRQLDEARQFEHDPHVKRALEELLRREEDNRLMQEQSKSALAKVNEMYNEQLRQERLRDPVYGALERARTFNGKRNRDWKPCIVTFPDLKIPDMSFCLVPVGSFQMGADDIDAAKPAHTQTIAEPYFIAQYPVTNAQWKLGVEAGAIKEPDGSSAVKWYRDPQMTDTPVVGVTWYEAKRFADWVGCRLSTELEWEYAARGVESLMYPWGNDWKSNACVWKENSTRPAPVSTRVDNVSWVGAKHLSGNVWEWTDTVYSVYPYRFESDLKVSDETGERVIRGGSWKSEKATELAAASRAKYVPFGRLSIWGLRLARSS